MRTGRKDPCLFHSHHAVLCRRKFSQLSILKGSRARPYVHIPHANKMDLVCSACLQPLQTSSIFQGEFSMQFYGNSECGELFEPKSTFFLEPIRRFMTDVVDKQIELYKNTTEIDASDLLCYRHGHHSHDDFDVVEKVG
jgi:hypothetical protein